MSTRETPPSTSRTSTPHSDEELDVVLRERYAERIRELARVPEQIQAAYRDAWQQYYVWEPAYCERTLRNLRTTDPSSAFALDDFLSDFGDLSDVDNSIEGEGNRVLYEQWIVDDDEVIYNAGAMEETSLPPCKDCAYPKYESCTPATRNIKHELDVRILQYMPYDDPSFLQHDLEEFARKHDVFAWQHSWYDVDFKLIALEAVYRLHSAGLSPEVLDQYSVDFFPSIDGSSGLSASMHHRDLLQWGDSYSSDSSAQVSALNKLRPSSASPHLGKSVDDMTTSFCASANCHEALCMLHRQRYPPFALDPATGNHKDLRRVTICGPNCFRSREAEKYPDVVEVNQEIYEALKLFPNESSCTIAKLCKTTCIAVFVHRELVLPDEDIPNSFSPRWHPSALAKLPFCIHKGPCEVWNGCICSRKKHKCQRRCRCQCQSTRAIGCRCRDCIKETCPCHLRGMECSPEFCISRMKAKGKKRSKHRCSFMTLQTRMPKKLAVYQGSFGLGTFATSDIPKESLLGEYIGEYFTMPLTQRARDRADEAQKMVFQHRGLNYLFGLNGDQDSVLDAATVGDPTRCLNHPPKGTKPNAAAEEINVDGDVKIYFTTGKKLVKKGRELLLDYGESYWGPSNNDKNVSDDESQ